MIRKYKKLFLFILPIVILILFFECFYRAAENDYTKKAHDIQFQYDKAEILVFGNSHPFYGINPKYIDFSTYNFSLISQTLYYDKLLFDKHIPKFKNLKCIILHIEYTTLAELVENKENIWRKYYYQHYMNVEIPNNSVFDKRNYFISFTRGLRSNVKLFIRYIKDGSITNCNDSGFGINYRDYSEQRLSDDLIQKRAIAIEDHLFDFEENLVLLDKMIKYCHDKDIKIVLLTLPNTKKFYDLLNPKKKDKMTNTLAYLDSLNQHVTYYNMIQHESFDYFDFYDADHLNHNGARKASSILNKKLKEIGMKN